MAKNILLLLSLFFLSISLQSQNDKDFLLTLQKDTLFGKIKFDTKTNVLIFYYQKQKVVFDAATINHFGIHRKGVTRIYKSITNDWKDEVSVEVLTEGKLNLYRYNTLDNKHYEPGSDCGYRYYLGETNKDLIRLSPTSYKKILKMVIKEFPSLLLQRILFKDVPRIIQTYNQLESQELMAASR